MKKSICIAMLMATAALSVPVAPALAEEESVEVIHHWVSEGEVKALNVIREDLAKKGVKWVDSAVGGLAGANALTALRSRIAASDPPGAMQLLGWEALTWSKEGQLRDISELAKKGKWDAVVPQALWPFLKDGDKWIAVPVNMHRVNWIWGNAKLFKDAGLEPPKSWDELISVGQKFKEKGIIPVALSDESWQLTQTFQSMMTDLYGPEFYTKAAVELDETALKSPEMLGTVDMLRKLRGLADDNFSGRDWAVASGMVINGQAAM
jgi:glucose/mannose transport system substrate-binding protein